MPIQFGSRLRSQIANETFLDKTIDDTTTGKLNLANSDSASGDPVNNVQKEINTSKKYISSLLSVDENSQISLQALSSVQIYRVQGNLVPVTLNSLVFSSQPLDGTEIILIGQSDTNTVKINFNDSQGGQYINDDATLKRGYILRMIWDSELERFLEIGRNF